MFVLFPLELSDYRPVVGLLQVEKLSGQDTAEAITEDAPFCLRGESSLDGACKYKEITCTRLSQTGASASLRLIFRYFLSFIIMFT